MVRQDLLINIIPPVFSESRCGKYTFDNTYQKDFIRCPYQAKEHSMQFECIIYDVHTDDVGDGFTSLRCAKCKKDFKYTGLADRFREEWNGEH